MVGGCSEFDFTGIAVTETLAVEFFCGIPLSDALIYLKNKFFIYSLLFFDSEYKDVASEEKKSLQESKKINPEECAVVAPVSQPLLDLENLTLTNETSDSSNGIQLLGDIFADKGIDENWSKEWEELFQVKDESTKSFSSKEIKEELCGEIQLTSNDNSNCLPSTLLNKMQLRSHKFDLGNFIYLFFLLSDNSYHHHHHHHIKSCFFFLFL